ncbi:MAG: DedA family protein [bacterium]
MESIASTIIRHSYLGLFILILACSFGFPFSKTLTLLGSGVLASRETGSLPLYMLAGLVGLVTADSIYFLAGTLGGERILRLRWLARPGARRLFESAEERFRDYGGAAVFSARFTPYLRGLVFLAAGMSRMPAARFLAADSLSALILVPAATLAGFLLSRHGNALVTAFSQAQGILAVVSVLVIAVLFLVPIGRGRRRS